MNYKVIGGKKLKGEVTTNVSKNAAVALLCASLLNRGRTTLKNMPKIEEVHRLIEVLQSIGVSVEWKDRDVVIQPHELRLDTINREAAGRTRSIAMFVGPLSHFIHSFDLPAPTGCDLGKRSLGSHVDALQKLGIVLTGDATRNAYHVEARWKQSADIIMYEASDTGVENVLMAAARIPGKTTIRFASANYMVQDLCVFLMACGVKIEGIGTSTLVVHGVEDINADIVGYPSEDPIESMFFIALAATTRSELTIKRCPIDFLELELFTLSHMGLEYARTECYVAENGHTKLCDIVVKPSALHAPPEKIAPRPYPGINIDNLPFFVPVATQAKGETLIHDWVYEGRAKHYMLMTELGADMELLDPHRVIVRGPSQLHGTDIDSPPALRPATILLIGMLAAEGQSTLHDVYPINRGYENLHERLTKLGASVEAL